MRRKRRAARARNTPVRAALLQTSSLLAGVRDGLAAVKRDHLACIDAVLRPSLADSLDLDEATRCGHEQENRWDYLLGRVPIKAVVGLEPHSANQGEISTVIAKRKAALVHLRDHLRSGARVARWFWVASGKVTFADTEKARRRLDQEGITFVGRVLTACHMPGCA